MTTFVLVHGAWHGAWSWEHLIPRLEELGHTAVAVDLPLTDPQASFADYADVILASAAGSDDVVLVGHSMGGVSVTYAGLRRDVKAIVYVCPLLPDVVGATHDDEPAQSPPGAFDALHRYPDGSHGWSSLEDATEALYATCLPDRAAAAFARLRPQQTAMWNDIAPLPHWPSARKELILCTDDRMFTPEWEDFAARRWLGCEPVALPGDHSPMIGIPDELAAALDRLAG